MSYPPVSICQYPLTVLLIDDNKKHLKMFGDFLKLNNINCITASEPKRALEQLNKSGASDYWIKFATDLSKVVDYSSRSRTSNDSGIDVNKLWQMTKSFQRFQDIGVTCIDKQMPELDGVELLKSITNSGIRTIMFTGYHDSHDVIKLVADGLIEAYLQKHDADVMEKLIHYIKRAINNYFLLANSFAERLMPGISSVLSNEAFCELHHDLQKQYNIVEYYIIDNAPSFLMLDADGKAIILGIIHEGELEAFDYLIKHADKAVPKNITNGIETRKKAPYFLHSKRMNLAPHELGEFLVDIKQIPNSKLYYTLIEDVEKYGFKLSEVKSYNSFLEQNVG